MREPLSAFGHFPLRGKQGHGGTRETDCHVTSVRTNVIKTVKGQRKRRARYTEQNGEKCMTKEQTKSA